MAVLSPVETSTVNPPSTGLSTVKLTSTDISSSFGVTSVMVTAALSSLVIVPVPTVVPKTTPVPMGSLIVTVKVSSSSTVLSPDTVTSIVFEVSPAAKVTVPDVAV